MNAKDQLLRAGRAIGKSTNLAFLRDFAETAKRIYHEAKDAQPMSEAAYFADFDSMMAGRFIYAKLPSLAHIYHKDGVR